MRLWPLSYSGKPNVLSIAAPRKSSTPAPSNAKATSARTFVGTSKRTWSIPRLRARSAEWRTRAPAGEPVHNMWLRLTIDLDLIVRDAEANTESGPYPHCGDIAPSFKSLIGLKIGPGGAARSQARSGASKAARICRAAGTVGTTEYQATGRARDARGAGKPVMKKPYQLNSCHVYRDDGAAVLERWPQFYTGSNP